MTDDRTAYYIAFVCDGYKTSTIACRSCRRAECDQDGCPVWVDAGVDLLDGPYWTEGEARLGMGTLQDRITGKYAERDLLASLLQHQSAYLRIAAITERHVRWYNLRYREHVPWPPPLHWTVTAVVEDDDE